MQLLDYLCPLTHTDLAERDFVRADIFLNLRVEPIVPGDRWATVGIKYPSVWTDSPTERINAHWKGKL